jgi:D-beta-D-heptose 7-phosphate kinase/D-beta-D-heptose 1-phosphate adenosyltransferase
LFLLRVFKKLKVKDFSNAKVLVVGDVMLDQYWTGKAGRISPEAPVPVVKVSNDEYRAGGAANVALNIATLGAQVHLLGIIGQDRSGEQLQQVLAEHDVAADWVYCQSGTICKLRVLSHHQQLIRMDFEDPVPTESAHALAKLVAEKLAGFDLLVISDYAKGALAEVAQMIRAARALSIPVLVDPKGLDFERYRGATLIKPNQSEFELIVGDCPDDQTLITKAQDLVAQLDLQALLVTRSEHGMALVSHKETPYLLSSEAQEVFDVTGAGDTVMATLATAMAAGLAWTKAVYLANAAASVVVRKVGTSTISRAELDDYLQLRHRHQGYVSPSEADLIALIKAAQAQGERVVITNGCFDILHSGHVRYLNEAAKLGDRLIVAVNSDASVARLKGSTRPVVPLASRMELLASLRCVDWVVPFEEDTPERLICALKPDVLVKGGDYRPEQIAGAPCVLARGGQVEVLSFWDGFSTTDIVTRIKGADHG